ncbi:MAG TPA: two-component system sensor histidine kinase KdpD [Candidimonas sp.]|nr:two-component system sensor histidine kinase KdpD [Candidimonas sp.]
MLPTDLLRPDPDALLAKMQEAERRASRGKLRIFFGACAGVGKTYSMLLAARKLHAEHVDVVVGVIETHGRNETAQLLKGLTVLPLKEVDYRGKQIKEFDIDAALALRPALILVDELAHSNAPGARHPKRWQDVAELLDAGIDVFTTLNVQHLESLNDVVGGITGIRVTETLPDTVFDHADDVVLVDIPPDELLVRLKRGLVYQGQQAERASHNFFRKGNLIALRELALRRTADRVQDDVQAYRIEKSIDAVWKIDAAVVACIGHRAGEEYVVRGAARLAGQLNTEWRVVYVETPSLQRLPSSHRERILQVLKLAEDLGAKTEILTGNNIEAVIVDYARSHNFSRLLLGRSHSSRPWRNTRLSRIAALAPDLDLTEIGRPETKGSLIGKLSGMRDASAVAPRSSASRKWQRWGYVWAAMISFLTILVTIPLLPYLDLANIVMLFLLSVVLVAVNLGLGPAVVSTFLVVAAFDFFFVAPRFSFSVGDLQYLVTLAVMLVVCLITAHLTAGLRYQARIAVRREARSRALYEFARELSGALQTEQIFTTTRSFIQHTFLAKAILLLPDDEDRLRLPPWAPGEPSPDNGLDLGIAQWSFDRATPAGTGTDTLPDSRYFYLPLVAPMRTRGVLAIQPENPRWILIPEQRWQLDTFAALAAIALERVHYVEVAQDALLHMESERLRNSLLAALSHDLRTPLTSLIGLSESLAISRPPLLPSQQELANALHEEALRMANLVSNLLDMARIQSGNIKLNLQWQPFEEVVGTGLRSSKSVLGQHQIQTRLAPDLPLVHFDAMLIERVLCNLLENAAKYTPAGSSIVIAAQVKGQFLQVAVYDNGPGLPRGKEATIFEKFTRGEHESATSGVGLGLAICQAIIQAHGGTIQAGQSPDGGASIIFTLPLGTPPEMPDGDEITDGYLEPLQ